MFDTDNFLATSVEGEMSTEFTPIPVGEYPATIDSVKARQAGKNDEYTMLDITWNISDPDVEEVTGRETNTVRQSMFLDITPSGGLDLGKGKNVGLGRLRDAIGQNGPGEWSPAMLEGNVAKVKVEHRLYEGQTFADVKTVAPL